MANSETDFVPSARAELRQMGYGTAAKELVATLRDARKPPEARVLSASLLGVEKGAAASAALSATLADGDARVRAAAALALGQRKEKAAVAALTRMLADADETVRGAALQALGRIGGTAAAKALAARLSDKSEAAALRAHAAFFLGRSGAPAVAVPALESALDDPSPEVKAAAAAAAAGLKDPRAYAPLVELATAPEVPAGIAFEAMSALEQATRSKLGWVLENGGVGSDEERRAAAARWKKWWEENRGKLERK
jgi:HEAT repeat protein